MILKFAKIKEFLSGNKNIKAVYIIVIIGVMLLMAPSFFEKEEKIEAYATESKQISEREIEKILSKISGVGKCHVLITYKSSGEYVTAKDIAKKTDEKGADTDEKNVIIGSGSGEKPFIVRQNSPEVLGAVIVCSGGGGAKIKNAVTEAVCALCGINANRVKVFEK